MPSDLSHTQGAGSRGEQTATRELLSGSRPRGALGTNECEESPYLEGVSFYSFANKPFAAKYRLDCRQKLGCGVHFPDKAPHSIPHCRFHNIKVFDLAHEEDFRVWD